VGSRPSIPGIRMSVRTISGRVGHLDHELAVAVGQSPDSYCQVWSSAAADTW
jgi:hypothetical protein